MSKRARIYGSAALVACGLASVASCSREQRLCDAICECEHCNDLAEDFVCLELDYRHDIAEVYGCESEWNAWADCALDEGRCEEDDANYTTREPGVCAGETDTSIPCTVSADCLSASYFCSGGTCRYASCVGTMQPCSDASDCPGGVDHCEDEEEAHTTCVANARG